MGAHNSYAHKGWPKGKKRGPMSIHHREKIRDSKIVARLIRHAEGGLDPDKVKGPEAVMTATQVNAALGLIKKFLPDMTYTEVDQKVSTDQKPTKIIIKGVSTEDDKK